MRLQTIVQTSVSGTFKFKLAYIPESFAVYGDGNTTASISLQYCGPMDNAQLPIEVERGTLALTPSSGNNADIIERADTFTMGIYKAVITTNRMIELVVSYPGNQNF